MALKSGKFPIFKKKIASFISKEDGKISKESLVKTGALVTVLSFAAAMNVKPASAAVDCSSEGHYDCTELPNPEDCTDCDTEHGPDHSNSLSLNFNGDTATGTHGHCIQSCHTSHASHGSHGSHCNCSGWR